jgi:hypothetical protein
VTCSPCSPCWTSSPGQSPDGGCPSKRVRLTRALRFLSRWALRGAALGSGGRALGRGFGECWHVRGRRGGGLVGRHQGASVRHQRRCRPASPVLRVCDCRASSSGQPGLLTLGLRCSCGARTSLNCARTFVRRRCRSRIGWRQMQWTCWFVWAPASPFGLSGRAGSVLRPGVPSGAVLCGCSRPGRRLADRMGLARGLKVLRCC